MFCSTGGIIENWMMIQNQVGRSVMLLVVPSPWSDEGVKVVIILQLFDDFTPLLLAQGHPMLHLRQGQLSHLPACEVELGHGVVDNNIIVTVRTTITLIGMPFVRGGVGVHMNQACWTCSNSGGIV